MEKLIIFKLQWLAKRILKKYQPAVIVVVGRIGKTGTCEAIRAVLSGAYTVRQNSIGADTVFKALWLLLKRDNDYPQILILEIGTDHYSRMQKFLQNIKPAITVVTSSDQTVLLHKNSRVVLNIDDAELAKLAKQTEALILTYGFKSGAAWRADHVRFSYVENDEDITHLRGISFKVMHEGATVPIFLPASIGIGQVYAALAALAVGTTYGMDLVAMGERLRGFRTPPGRMSLLAGIKQTLIIDDSYTATPASVLAAVDVLSRIPLTKPHRRIAVIGDMVVHSTESIREHEAVGRAVAKYGIDYLIVVGERSRDISRAAKKAGMDEARIRHFAFAHEAKVPVQELVDTGDVVLVTGNEKMHTEDIVKEIMAEPERAEELLVQR
jgi:UDP-N-acetylmuramoyl-tripeptide--D-alanyl-D-alanine ligase